MANQYGLEWKQTTIWGLEPTWTTEPSIEQIERIARQQLHLDTAADKCIVEFHAQGAFNKLYSITTEAGRWMMRVTLPVDPHRKTASEITTLEFVRNKTQIPVPQILGHDASNNNDLRFEWILMEYMPGTTMERAWRKMPLSKKEDMVKQLAQYQSDLFRHADRFQAIGNLYQTEAGSYQIGSIVSMSFFWADRGKSNVNRGPFRNSYEWLSARLSLVLEDQNTILTSSEDEDEIEVAESAKALAERLIVLLPTILSPSEAETTILFHDDLHNSNILVDKSGNITAILDWECVSVLPLWMACQLPAFLNGRTRPEEPRRESYSKYNPEVDSGDAEDSEGMGDLFWEHLEDYERGQLRRIFLVEMERLVPAWLKQYRDGELKRDLEFAILKCSPDLMIMRIEIWLDAYEKGDRFGLRQSLDA